MANENFKLAVLNLLANSAGGSATLAEVERQAEARLVSQQPTEQLKRFAALGEIDIFQSGLVLQDDAGLQITDRGRSLLHSLRGSFGDQASEPRRKSSHRFFRFFSVLKTKSISHLWR